MGISAKIFVWRATMVARRAATAHPSGREVKTRRRADWHTVDVNAHMRHLAAYSLFARHTS